MVYRKREARGLIAVPFLIIFAASAVLAAVQIRSGAGYAIGTWFPPLYFFLLFAVTHNLCSLKKILRRAYKPLVYIFYCGMAAFCIAFAAVCAYIINYSPPAPPDSPDLVIVLGARAIGYEPTTTLAGRLGAAAAALNNYPGATAIVAGGQGPNNIIPESRAMRQYLIRNNIYGGRVIEEDRSTNTFENLLFSRAITERYGLARDNIIIVTSEYHVPRAMMLAGRVFGGAQIYAVQSATPLIFLSAGITREFFAFVKSLIFDRE